MYSQYVSKRERRGKNKHRDFRFPSCPGFFFFRKDQGIRGCCAHHCDPPTSPRGLTPHNPKQLTQGHNKLQPFFPLACETPASMWSFMYYHSSERQGGERGGGANVGSAGSEGKHKTLTLFRHNGCTNTSRSGGGGGNTQVMGNLFYWEMGLHNWGPRQAAAPSLCENQAQARGDCRWISMRLSHARMDLKEALYRTRSAHTLTVPHGMYSQFSDVCKNDCYCMPPKSCGSGRYFARMQ